jgi:hypothetical protein
MTWLWLGRREGGDKSLLTIFSIEGECTSYSL